MHWINDGASIWSGVSMKDALMAGFAAAVFGCGAGVMAYRFDESRVFEKPLHELATISDLRLMIALPFIFIYILFFMLLSGKNLTLYKPSNIARITYSILFFNRRHRDVKFREVRVVLKVSRHRSSLETSPSACTWRVEFVPESNIVATGGTNVQVCIGTNYDTAVANARDAHLHTGLPTFTPDGTPIW